MTSLTVLLVDDQAMMRAGFAMILSVEDDLVVVGQAGNGAEAVEMAARLRPDVVLMDVQMPVMDGVHACRLITEQRHSRVIIVTTFDHDEYLFDGLRAGAAGFLLKNSEPEILVDAVRAVGHGHALLSPEVTMRVIGRMAEQQTAGPHTAPAPQQDERLRRLTDREREVLGLIGTGLSNHEIAQALFVGEATVKTHVSNILSKLHLRDRVQAVILAYEAGLIRPGGETGIPSHG